MKRALLSRFESNSHATFGALCDDESRGAFSCVTLELPWIGNARDISCIPAGTYVCRLRFSPKHKRDIYELQNVPGRDDVEIHIGNTTSDTEGCILVGTQVSIVHGTPRETGIQGSRDAFEKFMAWAGGEDFELVIEDPKPEAAA